MARAIRYVPLSEVTGNPANPKAHDVQLIDTSVGRFGFVEPLVRDERTNLLISGHGRTAALTALKERGDPPPEGVRKGVGGEWLVPVVTGWASRDDSEAGAALIALNRTGELGGWENEKLLDLLAGLAVDDNLAGLGFAEADISALAEALEAERNQTFLGDLSSVPGGNEFVHSGTWGGGSDEVTVGFPMSAPMRKVLLDRLNQIKDGAGVETLSEALFVGLELPLVETPPTPNPGPVSAPKLASV